MVIWSMHRQQQKQKDPILASLSQVTVCEEHVAIHEISMVGVGIVSEWNELWKESPQQDTMSQPDTVEGFCF